MSRIIRNSIYIGKCLYREKTFLFWTLLYPVILASFYYLAFSGAMNREPMKINIGIDGSSPIKYILEEIDMIHIEVDEGLEKLDTGDIDGYIDNEMKLHVNESGIKQSIIKEILDQILQTSKLEVPAERLDFTMNYISSKNQKADLMLIIFYAMIAMVTTYGIFGAIEIALIIQANLSEIGKRINITPMRKIDFLTAGLIDVLMLNIISNSLLLLYLRFVLKIELFTEYQYSLLLIFVGNLFGIVLGLVIALSNKQKLFVKVMAGIMTTIFLSFLSGLMNPEIKLILDRHVPIINKINPISIITDNLYKVNILGSTKNMGIGIMILVGYSIVLFVMAYMNLRRKTYDCI